MEDTLSVVTTAVELVLLAAAMGAAAGALWILPATTTEHHASQLLEELRLRLWNLLGVCLPILTIAALFEFLLRTAIMSDTPLQEAYTQLSIVLLKTHFGNLWLWRMGAVLLLWVVWGMQKRMLDKRILSTRGGRARAAGAGAL